MLPLVSEIRRFLAMMRLACKPDRSCQQRSLCGGSGVYRIAETTKIAALVETVYLPAVHERSCLLWKDGVWQCQEKAPRLSLLNRHRDRPLVLERGIHTNTAAFLLWIATLGLGRYNPARVDELDIIAPVLHITYILITCFASDMLLDLT